ncbi:hypothetical protein D3C75_667050 [compost metagenome]
MDQAQVVLTIEVFELAVEIAQAQLLAGGIVGPGKAEIPRLAATVTIQEQAGAVGGVPLLETVQMAGGQGQAIDISTGQLRTLVGLRQQSRIVVHQHRCLGQQGAMLDDGLPQSRLGRHTGTGELVRGTAIVMHRQQAGTAAPAARIEPYAYKPQGIEPQPQRALGEP